MTLSCPQLSQHCGSADDLAVLRALVVRLAVVLTAEV